MNSSQQAPVSSPILEDNEEVNLAEYFDILLDHRWVIVLITLIALLIGASYALLARPIYEANLMVQVEDSEKSAGSFLGDAASSLFDVKTPAAGEIEIIRSRMILGQAVENTKLYISARPKYVPLVGGWLSRRATELSDPGFFGMGGFVSGTESIVVPQFEVPQSLEGSRFTLTFSGDNKFVLSHPDLDDPILGSVGALTEVMTPKGGLRILVSAISAKPTAQFEVFRYSTQLTLAALQDDIRVGEKGKQSGVLDVSWQNADPKQLTQLLNEVGVLYVRQNIERKAAEAEKTLGFLSTELPKFKTQLEQSEDIYNRYRNLNGTVSLDEEAKNALLQTVDLQSKLIDAQQRRRELLARFTDRHPSVQTLDAQISAWNSEIASVDARIRKMPMLQQSSLRMQRDIKVNTDLYVSILNSSLQMRLAKEGKVGNVRLLDAALVPEQAVKPKKLLVIVLATVVGLIVGCATAIARGVFFGGIRNPNEIEIHTGLNVYSSIPLSAVQKAMEKNIEGKVKGNHVLAQNYPEDSSVESLRSLRTALQFAMLEASNNRLLITGATPSVGKSFVSVNFSAIMAASGKRVLLIDADLRKGRVNQFFSQPRIPGLSDLIAGSRKLEDTVRYNVMPNLDLLTTGVLPPNPAELLMSESFAALLDRISPSYDLVIIDTPPVLVAADTAAVAPHVATILLVARAETTHLGELNESVKRLSFAGSSVTGVILNAMDMTRRHYGRYGYKYGGYRYTQYTYERSSSST